MSGVNTLGDVAKVIENELSGGQSKAPAKAAPAQPGGGQKPPPKPKPATPLTTEGEFSEEELKLFGKRSPEPPEEEGKQSEILEALKNTQFTKVEDVVDAFKKSQTTINRLVEENKAANQRASQETKQLLSELVTALRPKPEESEEMKRLKEEDPEKYENVQTRKLVERQSKLIESLQNDLKGQKEDLELRDMVSQFKDVARDKDVPLDLLMSWGSTPEYANSKPEEIADAINARLDEMAKQRGYTKAPDPGQDNKPPAPEENDLSGIRPPGRGGSAAAASTVPSVDDLGTPGSKKWRQETEPKLEAILRSRLERAGEL